MELVSRVEQTEPEIDTWEAFWTLYPRHVAKKAARQAWDKIPTSQHSTILSSLAGWRRVWLDRGETQFIPHPATWLNGERWEDELPSEYRPKVQPQQIQQAKSEMPEHVRSLIAKLRAK